MPEREPVSARINPEVWKDAKHLAIDEETTVGVVVERALKSYIREKRGKTE